jgi:hypothetical protein
VCFLVEQSRILPILATSSKRPVYLCSGMRNEWTLRGSAEYARCVLPAAHRHSFPPPFTFAFTLRLLFCSSDTIHFLLCTSCPPQRRSYTIQMHLKPHGRADGMPLQSPLTSRWGRASTQVAIGGSECVIARTTSQFLPVPRVSAPLTTTSAPVSSMPPDCLTTVTALARSRRVSSCFPTLRAPAAPAQGVLAVALATAAPPPLPAAQLRTRPRPQRVLSGSHTSVYGRDAQLLGRARARNRLYSLHPPGAPPHHRAHHTVLLILLLILLARPPPSCTRNPEASDTGLALDKDAHQSLNWGYLWVWDWVRSAGWWGWERAREALGRNVVRMWA